MLRLNKTGHYETYMENRFAEENAFHLMSREASPLPDFHSTKSLLPSPFWEGHDSVLSCYWRAWELAFTNLRTPVPKSGFVANFVDTAFNDCLFMWDSAFILAFGRYGRRAFDFQRTLDNLYAKQHADGFICREIGTFEDRKSTRLNSSHANISYAVFCLKKKHLTAPHSLYDHHQRLYVEVRHY